MMFLARLLAFLGLLLLAPVAQAAPGDTASGSGLINIDALVEAPLRLAPAEYDADGPEGLAAQAGPHRAQPFRISPGLLPPTPVSRTRRPVAQPRAPPFQKA